jgi:N-acetylglucosaminyldiphosphoundecaprenol N-acetyl-beta-D-mannosaminyltransferase
VHGKRRDADGHAQSAQLQSFVERALLVVADGQPIVWCARLFGERVPERVTGIDLIEALCRRAAKDKTRVYLLGSTPVLVARAVARLRERHPGLIVDGSDGYFPLEQSAERAEAIRSRSTGLLFVGMGTPRQERYIEANWDRLAVASRSASGQPRRPCRSAPARAAVDGPRRTRMAGPDGPGARRLTPRYLVTNTLFCLLIGRTLLGRTKRWLL